MSSRLLVFAALLVAAAVPAAAQTLPCQGGQAADPCVITSPTSSIAVGVYDIRPRSLQVTNRQITITGSGEFKILAANITLQAGARIIAPGINDNPATPQSEAAATSVTLDATGTLAMQSAGQDKSKIDTTHGDFGGDITLHATGDITVNGGLTANATKQFGLGGLIDILSITGDVSVGGDPNEGIKAIGEKDGSGGSINLEAIEGSITVAVQLVAKNGDCGGSCEVDLTALGNVTTTAQGVIDVNASGIGDGGAVSATVGGNLNLAGNIFANGSSEDLEGGSGGEVSFDADGSVTLGRIEMLGAGRDATPDSENGSIDGDGGTLDVFAGTTIQLNGPILAIAKGAGSGGEINMDSSGNLTVAATVDVSGDWFGGDVTIFSEAGVTVGAHIRSFSIVDDDHFGGFGGAINIEACQVNVTSNGQLTAIGAGGAPNGTTFVAGSTALTVAGKVTSTARNELEWRTGPPSLTGNIQPAAQVSQNSGLSCCNVQCTTTTTSSTTTSSSTSTSSTSSSTLPGGTTSTTSSSTTTVVPTTSSTTTTSPTPTTTVPPTTSTTTTTLGGSTTTSPSTTTTTSSTSIAPSTSSTSVATPTTSVPTTTLPLTCLDTALGVDAVRCRLDFMSAAIGAASEEELGGRKLAKSLTQRVAKATKLAGDPTTTKRFKKAAKQLKLLGKQLDKGLANGKLDAGVATELKTLATEAQNELAGLIAG